MHLIPRSIVRMKNELLLDARYMVLDNRLRALAGSPEAGDCVTYLTYAGLANRLRAHYAADCIARRFGRRLVPLWMSTKELASDGSDIFPTVFVGRPELSYTRLQRLRISSKSLADVDRAARASAGRLLVLDYDAQWMPLTECRALMQRESAVELRVHDSVVAAASAILAQLSGPALTVHIRQTDFITHTPFARPVSQFEELIEQAHARQPRRFQTLVIASDDDVDISDRIRALFSQIKILTPAFRRTQPGVAPEALTHVLVLAAGGEFVPSPHSSFSELVDALRQGLVVVPGLDLAEGE